MLAVYKSFESKQEIDKIEGALVKNTEEFFEAENLALRIQAMIRVRYYYELLQIHYCYDCTPMDEIATKTVGQFHRISTTIVAEELGDDSQYLDKIMDKAWDIYTLKQDNTVQELLDSMLTEEAGDDMEESDC